MEKYSVLVHTCIWELAPWVPLFIMIIMVHIIFNLYFSVGKLVVIDVNLRRSPKVSRTDGNN
jgi:hypothetical protein